MKKSQKKKTKREKLFIEIYLIFKRSISDDDKELIQFLLENSNLPGRRANIELAQAFGDCIAKSEINSHNLIKKLLVYSQKIAPTNNPKEFLPFCGYFGVGAMTLNNSIFFDQSISLFRKVLKILDGE